MFLVQIHNIFRSLKVFDTRAEGLHHASQLPLLAHVTRQRFFWGTAFGFYQFQHAKTPNLTKSGLGPLSDCHSLGRGNSRRRPTEPLMMPASR